MKIPIEETTDEVEIGQYIPKDGGSLKGYFSMILHPSGLRISDCSYFCSGDASWFNFPQKEKKMKEGSTKREFIPLVHCLNKKYNQHMRSAVLRGLSQLDKEERAKPRPTNNQRSGSPFTPSDLPF